MSFTHYWESRILAVGAELGHEPDFYSIIMAAMRRADDVNMEKLSNAFPAQAEELRLRYNAPAGYVSREEAKSIGQFPDEELNRVWFPREGWPYGA